MSSDSESDDTVEVIGGYIVVVVGLVLSLSVVLRTGYLGFNFVLGLFWVMMVLMLILADGFDGSFFLLVVMALVIILAHFSLVVVVACVPSTSLS